MSSKVLCPSCGTRTGNEAIPDKMYGFLCCQDCKDRRNAEDYGVFSSNTPTIITSSKQDKRVAHWQDIKNRVTTHEGEFLTGDRGRKYQDKYGKKYLGISDRTNFNAPQYQRELAKTK